MDRGSRPTGDPAHNPWLIALAVTLGAFMEILDTTIVNVALPHIAGSMSVSSDDATWTLTSYLVANGIVLPISGWLAGVFGRRRYFLICIAMFTLCSFLCGIAEQPAATGAVPAVAGVFRRRPAAEPAVDHARHLRARERGQRLRGHRDRRPSSRRCWARRWAG